MALWVIDEFADPNSKGGLGLGGIGVELVREDGVLFLF